MQDQMNVKDVMGYRSWKISQMDGRNLYEREDYDQEAWIGFLKARKSYNPDKGSFRTRVSFMVWYHLLKVLDKANRNTTTPDDELVQETTDKRAWDMLEFKDELSSDAKVLTNLLFDTPKDLKIILDSAKGKNLSVIECMRRYVVGLGWKSPRFWVAAGQIRKKLVGAENA